MSETREIQELVDRLRSEVQRDHDAIERVEQRHSPVSVPLTVGGGSTVLMSGWRAHRMLATKAFLVDRVLEWGHTPDARGNDCTPHPAGGCACGRDDRVLQVLRVIAMELELR